MKIITFLAALASTAAAYRTNSKASPWVGRTTLVNLFDEENDGVRNNNVNFEHDVCGWLEESGIVFEPGPGVVNYSMEAVKNACPQAARFYPEDIVDEYECRWVSDAECIARHF